MPAPGEERTKFLRALDERPELIAWACGDERAARGEPFPCPFPGHAPDGVARVDRRSSAVVFVCDCDQFERSLLEVFYARLTRTPRRLGKAEFVVWKVRLAIEAGLLAAPLVELPLLPTDASEHARRVYDGLARFAPVRVLTAGPDDPFPFTRRFVAYWCGLTPDEARAGISALVRARILVRVGKTPAGGHHAYLYEVGPR